MEFKDYYSVMGLERGATPEDIKLAHRRLARKYHPDVSKEANAEARFKELAEAYDVLKDPEKRALYDRLGSNWRAGENFTPPPSQQSGQPGNGRQTFGEGGDFDMGGGHSDFFESLFKNMGQAGSRQGSRSVDRHGQDQHARIQISIEDSFEGASRTLKLKVPLETPDGQLQMQDRTIEFAIPKGIRAGQHIRLAAQGAPGVGRGSPGDLYLDVEFLPHPLYRTDHNDVWMDLPVAPWEAALGALVEAPTPTSRLEIRIPAGSAHGRKLRVKGRGLPGKTAGDFFFVLKLVLPAADSDAAKKAYADLASAFSSFDARSSINTTASPT